MGRIAWCLALGLSISCGRGGDPDVHLMPEDETPLPIIGRSFDVTTYLDGERHERQSVVIGSGDPIMNEMLGYLEQICFEEAHIAERFDEAVVEFAEGYRDPRGNGCGLQGAMQQQTLLCVGHKLLGMSEAVMPQDFVPDGSGVALRQRRLVEEIPGGLPTPLLTVPVQDNASRATFAMWASLAFQRAAMAGAFLIDTHTCSDGTMALTLPPYAGEEQRLPLSFVVASATAEAMHQMMDASERGQREVQAQAATLRSGSADPVQAVAQSFRAHTGSLLEAMSLKARVPVRLFDPKPTPIFGTLPPEGEHTTCPPDLDEHALGVQIFGKFAVSPTGSLRLPNLRGAMEADEPGIYATPALQAMSDNQFFAAIGTSASELEAAGDALHQATLATGRVTTPFMHNGVPRVHGLSPRARPTPLAFEFARTAGSARIDHVLGSSHAPVTDYGGFTISDIAGGDPASYGNGPSLEALDVVASALTVVRSRGDMQQVDAFEFTEAVEISDAARLFARTQVPMRTQTCVGKPMEGGVDQVRLRLYGADTDSLDNYGVWLGEAGLQCATHGSIEGVGCDPVKHQVPASAFQVVPSATRSGLGDEFVEILIDSTSLPEGMEDAVPATHLYVTDSSSGTRRAITGIDTTAGANPGAWSRCTVSPAGASAMAAATAAIQTSPDDCSEPIVDCAGLPFDQRVPLEDEIAEARGRLGGDELDTSWEHYLTMARQAADEADALGQQLVQNGLEFDLRLEAAAEAVGQICGVNVPVGHVPGSTACPCGDGYECHYGACYPSDISTYLPEGVNDAAIEACLNPGASTLVTLGTRDYCVWRHQDGPPCASPETPEELTQCPFVLAKPVGQSPTCEGQLEQMLPGAATMGYTAEPTFPLQLFQETAPPADKGACHHLSAMVRGGADLTENIEAVLEASWLEQGQLDEVAQALRWIDGPLAFSGIRTLDGSSGFASLGTMFYGPNDEWPCAPHPSMDTTLCDGGPDHWPLGCGYDCSQLSGVNGRLEAASQLKRALSVVDALVARRFGHHPMHWDPTFQFTDHTSFGSLANAEFLHLDDPVLCEAMGGPMGCLPSAHFGAHVVGHASRPGAFTVYAPGGGYPNAQNVLEYGANGWLYPVGERGVPSRISKFNQVCGDEASIDCIIGSDECETVCTSGIRMQQMLDDMWVGSAGTTRLIDEFLADYPAANPSETIYYADWNRPGAFLLDTRFVGLTNRADRLHYEERFHGPPINLGDFIGPSTHDPIEGGALMTNREIMRGLELSCYAINSTGVPRDCGNAAVPDSLNSIDDLDALSQFADCQAKSFRAAAGGVLLSGIPQSLAQSVRDGVLQSSSAHKGQLGEAVGALQAELAALGPAIDEIEAGVRDVGIAVAFAASELRVNDLQGELNELELAHSAIGHHVDCQVAMGQTVGLNGAFNPGLAMAAAATCAGGVAQLMIEQQMGAIEQQILSEHAEQILLAAVEKMLQASDRMGTANAALHQSMGRIGAILAQIENLQREAQVQLSKVLVHEEGAVGEGEYPVNSVMRTRLATSRIRYERARENAVRLAWLARRAVEQRFGVNLDDIDNDLSLVDRPSNWASSVCELGGINYAKIRGELEGPIADYADEFIGDWLRKLELFVESYRLDYPTENGQDLAVASLRDDFLGATESCETLSYNLLSDSISMQSSWDAVCGQDERCPFVSNGVGGPFRDRSDWLGNPDPRRLGNADALLLGSACQSDNADLTAQTCSATAQGAGLQQAVALRGQYLLSWYEPVTQVAVCTPDDDACVDACAATHPIIDPGTSMPHVPRAEVLIDADGPVVAGTPAFLPVGDPWLDGCNWRRVVMTIEAPETVSATIGFRQIVSDLLPLSIPPVEIAAPQLEALNTEEAMASVPPRRYFPSDDDRMMELGRCPDYDGDLFRSSLYWTRKCDRLCPEGLAESCVDGLEDRNRVRCYHEAKFYIGQDAIDRGELFPNGGFASGNFNYRHNGIAINLVGVGVRDCESAANPGACYSSGSVPFSLRHDGPYWVRNYDGEDYSAPLFVGNIQHGRALTAERYLTNPLSGADRGLLTDYWRDEFRGRPLSGAYTLRIYDSPGLQWQNVEDVQIVLDYGYWTRFE